MSNNPLSQFSKLTDIAAGAAGLLRKHPGANKHQIKGMQRASLLKLMKGAGIKAEIPEDPSKVDMDAIVKQALATVPESVLAIAGDKVRDGEKVAAVVKGMAPVLTEAVQNAVKQGSVNIHDITDAVVSTAQEVNPESDVTAAFNIMNNALAMVGGPQIDESTELTAEEPNESDN